MDYDILNQMAQEDISHRRFTPGKGGGFDVQDVQVFDEALWIMENIVLEHCINIDIHQSVKNELLIIEFARENYDDTFNKLSQAMLQNAFFLLIDADFDICKERIQKRMASPDPDNNDNHNVSDFAMNTYFREQLPPKDTTITSPLMMLNNNGLWEDFTRELEPFIRKILNIQDSNQ